MAVLRMGSSQRLLAVGFGVGHLVGVVDEEDARLCRIGCADIDQFPEFAARMVR